MTKRKWFLFSAIVAVVMLMGMAGCTPAELQALQGTLQNVDSASGTVTVKMKDGTTQTFNFTDVTLDTVRQSLGNATLEIGDQVTIKTKKNGDVDSLEAENAEIVGVIKTLGTDSVTITTEKKGDILLKVTTQTTVKIEGKTTSALADLSVGQKVEVKYDVNTLQALKINVDNGVTHGELQGTLKAIDITAKSVTITTQKNGDVILLVTADTVIRAEPQGTATLANLQVGEKVEAKYDVATMKALRIQTNMGHNNGAQGNQDKKQHNKD